MATLNIETTNTGNQLSFDDNTNDKLHLSLSRFRHISSLDMTLPTRGIVLLDGVSGIGKTTLLDAIQFVFYDGLGSSCYHRAERSSRKKRPPTWVSMKFPDGTFIRRQRRPNTLVYQHGETELLDDAAQGIIESRFGSAVTWHAGCRIKQEHPCGLFTMNANEKLALFHQLTTKEDAFDRLIEKTIDCIEKTSRDVDTAAHDMSSISERIDDQRNMTTSTGWTESRRAETLGRFEVTSLDELSDAVQEYFQSERRNTRSALDAAKRKQLLVEEWRFQQEQLNTSIEKAKESMRRLTQCPDTTLKKLESDIIDTRARITAAERTKKKDQLLATRHELTTRLSGLTLAPPTYTREQVVEYQKTERTPSIAELTNTLNEINVAENWLHKKPKYQRRDAIDHKLSSLPTESCQTEIETLDHAIWHQKLKDESLECPKCGTSLLYSDKRLVESKTKQIGDVDAMTRQRQHLITQEKAFAQRAPLEEERNTCPQGELEPPPPIADKTLPQLTLLENKTKSMLDAKKKLPDINLKEEMAKIDQEDERAQITSHIRSIDVNMPSGGDERVDTSQLRQSLETLTASLEQARCDNIHYAKAENTLEQLQKQIRKAPASSPDPETIPQLEETLTNLEQECRTLENDIQTQRHYDKIAELTITLKDRTNKHTAAKSRLGSLKKIKTTLITAEYIILDAFTGAINTRLDEILPSLFDDPVTVRFRSLKQLKTDQRISPKISVQVVVDGNECSSINEVSGGEKSRISLALAIVFSEFNHLPFLLLDESLSSLDATIKERAMQTLRKYASDKLVIAVNHDTTTGVYDSVIRLFY